VTACPVLLGGKARRDIPPTARGRCAIQRKASVMFVAASYTVAVYAVVLRSHFCGRRCRGLAAPSTPRHWDEGPERESSRVLVYPAPNGGLARTNSPRRRLRARRARGVAKASTDATAAQNIEWIYSDAVSPRSSAMEPDERTVHVLLGP